MQKTRNAPPSLSAANSPAYLAYFNARRDSLVATTRELVEAESPSDHKPSLDALAGSLAGAFADRGAKVTLHRSRTAGNHVQADFPGRSGAPILLLGHYDTVYPLGTLANMPCREVKGRLTGPGVLDMKSGIALMLHAVAAVREIEGGLPCPITVLLVSDEEVGSDSSRSTTEKLARRSRAVLVLEPSYGLNGAVKTARKGVGEYKLSVSGKAAHSGLDFEKGVNAIRELARQIEKVSSFTDLRRGLTVNVGLVEGGTRVNVVPASASATVDVRIARLKDAAGIERKMRGLRPFDRKCQLQVEGGINRPPMERTPGVAALYQKAVGLARTLGWKLDEAAVGGGSDGNFTAALGVPTLDGLGGVGDGAHATHEHILISELPRRAALLALLLRSV